MKVFSTILEAINYHASETPDKVVITWVDIRCQEQNKMTFKQLENESNAVAARLLKLGCKKGDRVMVAYPFGLEFLAGMFGAMKIGVIPCSIYPPNPNQLKTDMPKFRGFAEDAGAKYALSTNVFAAAMTAASVLYKSGVTWIGTDKLPIKKSKPNKPKDYETFVGEPEDICFIQYTSGSTGRPKGVMIGHHNLVENIRGISCMSDTDVLSSTVAALWVPQYHDMGLVAGFMSTIYGGIHLVMASPLDFIANPLLWSDMVETYKATLTCAPNFAYALLLKRLQQANRTADWSCVRRAMFGGEPSQSHIVAAVAKTLSIKPENLYNIYGMAESVVFLTGGPAYPDSEGLVSCGEVNSPTLRLRIVEDGKEVKEGHVGSIWAQSPRVAAGYYGQSELSTAAFANALPSYDGTWLDTGDLGKIVDGQLYVTGRVKDVIIINGKNYYPSDLELSIDDLFGHDIRPGRTTAFQHGEDSVGITVEGRKGFEKSSKSDLAVHIANHVSQVHGLFAVEVVVLKLGVTPKTTSGKLKRSLIRQTTLASEWKASSVLLHFERREVVAPLAKDYKEQLHVAVVGAGAAGLVTALRLAQRNINVTLLERNEKIGGHARHVEVFGHERNPAFGVFLAEESPNLIALTEELEVEALCLAESRHSRGIVTMGEKEIPSVSQAEANRFIGQMQIIHKAGTGQDETIGQYFIRSRFDQHFIVYFYIGKIVSFFPGQTIQDYLNIPLELVAWFVVSASISKNDLLRLRNKDYMQRFESTLRSLGVEMRTNVSTEVVSRDATGVTIRTSKNDNEEILEVHKLVLAVPPNSAVKVLGLGMSPQEQVLAEFYCPLETVVLHQDSKWSDLTEPNKIVANIPDYGASLPSFNDTVPITTSLVSDTDHKTPVYVTHAYATHEKLEFDSPVEKMSFTHTKITCKTIQLRNSLLQNQGKHSTYFAGGWTRGKMLHEDAVVSGILAANAILEACSMVPHPVLERETPVPSNQLISKAVAEVVLSDIQAPTNINFSARYANVVMSVFGSEFDSSKTWTENGLTSLKSAELRNKLEEAMHVVLPANFEQLHPTPKALSAFLEASEGRGFPIDQACTHSDVLWSSTRSKLSKLQLGVLQTFGSIVILQLLLISVVPSFFLVSWVLDQCGSSETGVCNGPLNWVLLPATFPLFILSFSLIVVFCKYAVIGTYRHHHFELLSWSYLHWWFMDRLMEVWESLVGPFYVETKYIWIFYWLLGADLAWSAKIESFIREFDLVKVGGNATIGYPIKCRKFSLSNETSPLMTFRPIVVESNSHVSGMIGPGAKIGDGSKVEKLSVVQEGALVPDGVLARGNPAYNAGSFKHQKASSAEESMLDVFKIVWTIFEAYHFFMLSYLVHATLSLILPSWRYSGILHWILLFPMASFLALLTSIALKWLLIGKRDPSDKYEGSLWRRATNWACDFHFHIAAWPITPFIGHSKLWTIILFSHGLDVDMVSELNINPHTQFTPSRVDYVKIRNSFLSTISLDLNHECADRTIEIINSSIGYGVNLHAGIRILHSVLPPRADVSESVMDLNQSGLTFQPNLILDMVVPEIAQQALNVVLFASIIPSFEVGHVATTSSSATSAVLGLMAAVVLQMTVWNLSSMAFERILLNLPSRAQQVLFGAYINHVWLFRVRNWLVYLLYGTPMFGQYASMMGAEVDGDLWFFGHTLYEFGRLHFRGCTIIDSSYVSGHFIDGNGLSIDDTIMSGVLHPGCVAIAGSVGFGENGPWKLFLTSGDGTKESTQTPPGDATSNHLGSSLSLPVGNDPANNNHSSQGLQGASLSGYSAQQDLETCDFEV
ncbi:D-alanine--D-alanyl carrier protein ligase [Seminavis robusta]|uniref:D-alanine--D-alanyl carrier protein ligase n=1 Tax=Seminavis robusta TaxID=568900 RepID=A0A9N8DT12_9STRA|nr:D-alanine--D-alanyl carrier protein ligase [Seminavis robusta]|eukprot:Sro329_g118780.1 D-alanine--D-alanyl carrier protein ligase (1811) ;mRNA; f:15435-21176